MNNKRVKKREFKSLRWDNIFDYDIKDKYNFYIIKERVTK